MTGKAPSNIDGYKMSNYRDIREFCIVATAPSNIAGINKASNTQGRSNIQ